MDSNIFKYYLHVRENYEPDQNSNWDPRLFNLSHYPLLPSCGRQAFVKQCQEHGLNSSTASYISRSESLSVILPAHRHIAYINKWSRTMILDSYVYKCKPRIENMCSNVIPVNIFAHCNGHFPVGTLSALSMNVFLNTQKLLCVT